MEMAASIVKDNLVKSPVPYDCQLPKETFKKNLAAVVFDELDKSLKNKDADNVAIVNARNPSESLRLSKDLRPMSVMLAKSMKANGFKRGDVIQLLTHNNPDFFIPVFATWMCGGVASVISPNFRVEALTELFASTSTSVIFCYPKIAKNIIKGIEGLEKGPRKKLVVVLDQIDPGNKNWKEENHELYRIVKWSEFLKEGDSLNKEPNEENFEAEDDVVIFWSSGTTGAPKGAIYHYDLLARMVTHEKSVFVDPSLDLSTMLVTTNFFHAGSFTFNLVNGIKSCNTIIVFSSPDEDSVIKPTDFHRACHDYKVKLMKVGSHHATHLGYAVPEDPTLDLSSLQYILPMGAPVNQGLTMDIRKNFPNLKELLINYGSTEMFLVSRTTVPGELGQPYQGVEYRILSQDDNETFLGPNEVGEILSKTPYIMKGYLKKDQNAAFFRPDGFVHTGDLGYYREDGTLVFKSRLKELIKYNGNHLYPMEIENIIKKHPSVAEVAVFGMPCPEVQELVTAVVVKNGAVTAEEIKQIVIDSGVEEFKHIRGGVKFSTHIPKNTTGKTLRMVLPDFYNCLKD